MLFYVSRLICHVESLLELTAGYVIRDTLYIEDGSVAVQLRHRVRLNYESSLARDFYGGF